MRFTRDDRLIDPFERWKQERNSRRDELVWLHLLLVSSVAAWTAWALRRTKLLWIGIALSLTLYAFVLNLPGYYFSIFLILAVLVRSRPQISPLLLCASAATGVVSQTFYFIDDEFAAQSWLFLLLSVLLLVTYSRPPRFLRGDAHARARSRARVVDAIDEGSASARA